MQALLPILSAFEARIRKCKHHCRSYPPLHFLLRMIGTVMSNEYEFTKAEAERVFSVERLNHLRTMYKVDNERLLELHTHLGLLNGAIYASVSLFELQLRNNIIECMDCTFGDTWIEFSDPMLPVLRGMVGAARAAAKSNKYAKMPYLRRKALKANFPAAKEKDRKKEAKKTVMVSRNDTIPYLYFSFWRKLFTKPYEHYLWKRGLKKVFPSTSISRGQVSDLLEICLKVRNRISHNEFVHPELCYEYIIAIEFLTSELGYGDLELNQKLSVFHKPYIDNIQRELDELNSFLDKDGAN